jgi:hypothetical protein
MDNIPLCWRVAHISLQLGNVGLKVAHNCLGRVAHISLQLGNVGLKVAHNCLRFGNYGIGKL